MASLDTNRVRQIRIKTGVVKRLAKEKEAYKKEVILQEARIEKMKVDGKDEYDIRKQGEVLEESVKMIPDCTRRLVVAWDDLNKVLETEADLAEAEEYVAAKEMLDATKCALGR